MKVLVIKITFNKKETKRRQKPQTFEISIICGFLYLIVFYYIYLYFIILTYIFNIFSKYVFNHNSLSTVNCAAY